MIEIANGDVHAPAPMFDRIAEQVLQQLLEPALVGTNLLIGFGN